MDKDNIFYLWGSEYLPSLRRRHEAGEYVSTSDLDLICRNDPEAFSDPLMQEYLLRSLRGELRPKKTLNKRDRYSYKLRVMMADFDIEDRKKEIWASRKRGETIHKQGDFEPVVQAANEVAEDWHFGTGRSLLNAISAQKLRVRSVKALKPAR